MYEVKMEFPEGWGGGHRENPFREEVWIFSGTTQYHLRDLFFNTNTCFFIYKEIYLNLRGSSLQYQFFASRKEYRNDNSMVAKECVKI